MNEKNLRPTCIYFSDSLHCVYKSQISVYCKIYFFNTVPYCAWHFVWRRGHKNLHSVAAV